MSHKKFYLAGGAVLLLGSALMLQEPQQAFASTGVTQDYTWSRTQPQALLDPSGGLLRYLPPRKYADVVYRYCAEQHLAVDAVCRLVWGESKWNPYDSNVNRYGMGVDRGLMQLNSRCLEDFASLYNEGRPINVYNGEENLKVGIRHLGALVRKYGNLRLAYNAWNAGKSRAYRPPHKTKLYVASLTKE